MSRTVRLVLLVGCGTLGALHLPAASRALSDGLASPLGEVRAMERATAQAGAVGEAPELSASLAQRD